MTEHLQSHEKDPMTDGQPDIVPDEEEAREEFRVTIRKLEVPVRPRGVLAE